MRFIAFLKGERVASIHPPKVLQQSRFYPTADFQGPPLPEILWKVQEKANSCENSSKMYRWDDLASPFVDLSPLNSDWQAHLYKNLIGKIFE